MDLWVVILLFLLALVALGVAIYLAIRYARRPKQPKAATQATAEKSGDVTLMEGVGLDDGTLVSGAFSVATKKSTGRLRYTTRGVANDVLLDQKETSIGRGTSNQIDLGDLLVSRKHARIVLEDDGEYWIEDLQSHNHTFVNGVAITRQRLSRDDQIKVGETILTFARDGA